VDNSSSWAPTAQPQRQWSQHPLCRRCGSLFHPGLRTCRSCGASTARALGRTLRAAAFIILLLCLFVLAVALAVHASSRSTQVNGQAPATSTSPGPRLPRLAGAAAPPSAGPKVPHQSASKETVS
jgi:ribosomal protein L37E